MIKRILADKALRLIRHFPVIGIVGPRQVGKTTLAQTLVPQLNKESLYLDLERPSDLNKLRDPELYLSQHLEKTVIIDEIQRMPELFPLMRALIDQKREPGRYIILGSASPELLRESSESLAGRIAYLELHPFHISELEGADFRLHWNRGGYPEAYLAPDDEISRIWRQNFIQSYLERDLPALGLASSATQTRRLFQMISSVQGQTLNYSMLSKSLGVSVPTVKKQIDFLEDAFLVRRLQPFHLNIKKRLVKSPKIFIRDSGILHLLLGINTLEELYADIKLGASWETYVIQQIISASDDSLYPYFYRTQDGSEADLVMVKGNRPFITFEIKYSNAPKLSRGNSIAIADLGAPHNYIITPSADTYPYTKNISVVNVRSLWDILEKIRV